MKRILQVLVPLACATISVVCQPVIATAQNANVTIRYSVNTNNNCRIGNKLRIVGSTAYETGETSRCGSSGTDNLDSSQGSAYRITGRRVVDRISCKFTSKTTMRCSNGDTFKGDYAASYGSDYNDSIHIKTYTAKYDGKKFSYKLDWAVNFPKASGSSRKISTKHELAIRITANGCRVEKYRVDKMRMVSQTCQILR